MKNRKKHPITVDLAVCLTPPATKERPVIITQSDLKQKIREMPANTFWVRERLEKAGAK